LFPNLSRKLSHSAKEKKEREMEVRDEGGGEKKKENQ
jgi:hypothetical protein